MIFGFPAWAALDISDIGVGARPLGMGKAFIAEADDASAIFMNPAGLARNDSLNIVSMAGTMMNDVNYIVLGASDLSPMGKFGFGYLNASVTSIPLTALTGSGSTLEAVQYATADYGSNQFIFAYGSKLNRFLKNGAGANVSLGASLKIFSQGFSGGATTPAGGANPLTDATGGGMDADLGMIWDANRWATVGLVLQNFVPTSFGGRFVWQKNSVTEGIPMVIKAGGQMRVIGPSGWRLSDDSRLDVLLDYQSGYGTNRPSTLHLGAEYLPVSYFTLRAGLDQKPRATEAGIGVDNNLTFGAGLFYNGFSFDYAYHQFGEIAENTTHFFSIGYKGLEKYQAKAKGKDGKKKNSAVPLAELVAKPPLKTFIDVPEDYWAKKPIEYLATLGMMDGYEDGTYKPTKELTRGELAVILVRSKGFEVGKEVKVRFSDVPLQSFDAPYVSLAVERKYITGFPDGRFLPMKRVTRAEMAVIIARYSGLPVKSKIKVKPFGDLAVDHWAAPSVAADKDNGMFAYLGSGGFGPDMYITRAEAAEIISKTSFAKQKIDKLISGE